MFEDLIPELQSFASEFVTEVGRAGLAPRVTSTRRTRFQQARLFRRWQQGLSPYPAAPPGLSAHEFGYAFDLVVTPMSALHALGRDWIDWGGVWSPHDEIHFEYPGFVAPVSSFDFPSELGTAMGKGAGNILTPASGSIPYVQDILKVSAEMEPAARASLAAQVYLWLANR